MKFMSCVIVILCLMLPLTATDLDPAKLKKSKPVAYRADEDVFIKGRYIKADDVGVLSTSSSTVYLERCYIVAGTHGIKCMGAGDVYIKNCYVDGFKSAIFVGGAGDVYTTGTTFAGRLIKEGEGADFHDQGGNEFYADATDVYEKFTTVSSKYMNGLGDLTEAAAVANALNEYSKAMNEITQAMAIIKSKYPELKRIKSLKRLVNKTHQVIGELKDASAIIKKFADDPAVTEALKKYQEVVEALKEKDNQ